MISNRSTKQDPYKVTNFSFDDFDLELFAIFAIVVAAKNADVQSEKLDQFLSFEPNAKSPLDAVEMMLKKGTFVSNMVKVKLGQYDRLAVSIPRLLDVNLRTCTIADLENIHGIGRKTSRFFILHSRPAQRICALDTMLLCKAIDEGYPNCPTVTPSNYQEYEKISSFLLDVFDREANELGLSHDERYAHLDLKWWKHYRNIALSTRQETRSFGKKKKK